MKLTLTLERRPRIKEIAPLNRPPRVDKKREQEDELLAWLEERTDRREIRQDAGWTQAEVADHIGCSPGLVTKWERGTVGWSREFRLRYARLLRELEPMRDEEGM